MPSAILPFAFPNTRKGSNCDHLDRETARIDALIAKKTKFIELLAKKRQALITHAVTKGLNSKAKTKDSGVGWIRGGAGALGCCSEHLAFL